MQGGDRAWVPRMAAAGPSRPTLRLSHRRWRFERVPVIQMKHRARRMKEAVEIVVVVAAWPTALDRTSKDGRGAAGWGFGVPGSA